MGDDRHVRRDPRGGLVQRREVVQVQDVEAARADALERRRPRGDVRLVGGVVDRREDPIGRARAVLEGRMHRRVAGGEVDRVHVEAAVEALGVPHAAAAQRAAEHRHVPAVGGQLLGQRAGDVRRAAAGEEHEAAERAHLARCTRPVTGR
jgi:hypothetical protein